ncbi:unnamed protein product, partial [Timema podura]|nr:unnamed protein product [Timema podura]
MKNNHDTRLGTSTDPHATRYFQGTVNIHLVDGDHRTLLSNRATADIINNEALANICGNWLMSRRRRRRGQTRVDRKKVCECVPATLVAVEQKDVPA